MGEHERENGTVTEGARADRGGGNETVRTPPQVQGEQDRHGGGRRTARQRRGRGEDQCGRQCHDEARSDGIEP
ncbi:hypothetical protein ACGFYP_34285 [Streptomyces sp. NPDC048370]|uniref:hypothetical protein n=1 Tax=Streptomyces sp. NPDC048370 TaxID=3365540 RepID=UPI00371B5889